MPDVDNKNRETGISALHEAAWNASTTVIKLLLEADATVGLRTEFGGDTALHKLLARPKFSKPQLPSSIEDSVEALLKAGADPKISNLKSLTPVRLAAENCHTVALRRILENPRNRGSRNRIDADGDFPLHTAARMGPVDEIESLLGDNAVRVDTLNKLQQTPLSLATYSRKTSEWSRHEDAVGLLLDRGADTTHIKINELTMLDWAIRDGGRSGAGNLILRKEYMSWQQEPRMLYPWRYNEGAGHGRAATEFEATAMWFYSQYFVDAQTKHGRTDHGKCCQSSINDLIYSEGNAGSVFDRINTSSMEGFAWFHIPENSMQWVDDLHKRIYSDQRAHLSDAAEISPMSFQRWFNACRPHRLAPTFRRDAHHGLQESIQTVFISIPYRSVERHRDRL